jgi:hypothetical protein
MKKLAVVTLVLGLFAGAAWAVGRSPERSACIKLGELCGDASKSGISDLDQCIDSFKTLRKMGGDEPADKAMKCVDASTTCPQAMGCIVGGGYAALPGAMKEFAKGFEAASK